MALQATNFQIIKEGPISRSFSSELNKNKSDFFLSKFSFPKKHQTIIIEPENGVESEI